MISMRSLHRCVGCGDVVYAAASANYEGKFAELEGLVFCTDARRARLAPKLACARSAARQDQRFAPLVTELELLAAQTKARWGYARKAVRAAVIGLVFLGTTDAALAAPWHCKQTDPKACGGSPTRCNCAGKVCSCVVVRKVLRTCQSCDPKRSRCKCSCESGACCCE